MYENRKTRIILFGILTEMYENRKTRIILFDILTEMYGNRKTRIYLVRQSCSVNLGQKRVNLVRSISETHSLSDMRHTYDTYMRVYAIYMCMRVYVCMYVYMYVCMYASVCMYVYMYVCMYASVCMRVYVYMGGS